MEHRKSKLLERHKDELTQKQRQLEEQLSIHRKDVDTLREKKEFAEKENFELKKEIQKITQTAKSSELIQGTLQDR